MGKGIAYANKWLLMALNRTNYAGIADAGSATLLYVSLHTSEPTTNQQSSECNYPGYSRHAVSRNNTWFKPTNNTWKIGSNIVFGGYCTGGTGQTVQFVGFGTSQTGPGQLLYYTPVARPLLVVPGTQPIILAAPLTFTEA